MNIFYRLSKTSQRVCQQSGKNFHKRNYSPSKKQPLLHQWTSSRGLNTASTEQKKKKFEVPWGFIKNNKLLLAKRERIKSKLVLSPDETEELRNENNLSFDKISSVIKSIRQNSGESEDPFDYFQEIEKYLPNLQSRHLIERFVLSKADRVPLTHLFVATTLFLATDITQSKEVEDETEAKKKEKTKGELNNRIKLILQIFSTEEILETKRLAEVIAALRTSCQLPVRVLTTEVKEYPLNRYETSTDEEIVERALREVNKIRKKAKQDPLGNEISFDDFKQLLLSRNICAWGECN
eukprot:maker-scaffold_4-snap-gene-15.4-mRNA-1 protein AED:0.07 eAED:0.26 QI:0/0/0.5/1/1/1/2/64/294